MHHSLNLLTKLKGLDTGLIAISERFNLQIYYYFYELHTINGFKEKYSFQVQGIFYYQMIIVHEMFCTVKYLYELCAVWPGIRRHTQRWELHQRFILTNLENDKESPPKSHALIK